MTFVARFAAVAAAFALPACGSPRAEIVGACRDAAIDPAGCACLGERLEARLDQASLRLLAKDIEAGEPTSAIGAAVFTESAAACAVAFPRLNAAKSETGQ